MWKDFFTLSRTEQKATLALLIILVLSMLALAWASVGTSRDIEIKMAKSTSAPNGKNSQSGAISPMVLDSFNPNSVTIKELEKMGFGSRTIMNWKKYIEAGGRFKSVDDLYNLYGIDSALVDKVAPFVCFDGEVLQRSSPKQGSSYAKPVYLNINKLDRSEMLVHLSVGLVDSIERYRQQYYYTRSFTVHELTANPIDSVMRILAYAASSKHKAIKSPEIVLEINSADSIEFDLLKGIGPAFARRIVFYRQKLGGFYSVEQLLEVDGISPELFDGIRGNLSVNTSLISPININKASLRKLKEHPYIGFYKARDIIEYRKTHGGFGSLDQVWALEAFKEANKNLLAFYLAVN